MKQKYIYLNLVAHFLIHFSFSLCIWRHSDSAPHSSSTDCNLYLLTESLIYDGCSMYELWIALQMFSLRADRTSQSELLACQWVMLSWGYWHRALHLVRIRPRRIRRREKLALEQIWSCRFKLTRTKYWAFKSIK